MLIEIFKTGTHTDSKGIAQTYTADMLDTIVNNYEQQVTENPNNRAPLVKGHPTANEPALGWVKKLFRRGKTLLAHITNIDQQLLSDIRDERYKNFSIALHPSLNIRHIGILGAVPPAVKGLNKNGIVCFHSENPFSEYECEVENTNSAPSQPATSQPLPDNIHNNYADNDCCDDNNCSISSYETENKLLKDKLSEYTNLLTSLQDTNSKLVAQLKELEKQNRCNTFSEYANSIMQSNKISFSPSQKSTLVDMLELAYQADVNNYSADDNDASLLFSERTDTLTHKIKHFIETLNSSMKHTSTQNYAEQTALTTELELKQYNNANDSFEAGNFNRPTDQARHKMHLEAVEYCKQHPTANYSDAIEYLFNSKW